MQLQLIVQDISKKFYKCNPIYFPVVLKFSLNLFKEFASKKQ